MEPMLLLLKNSMLMTSPGPQWHLVSSKAGTMAELSQFQLRGSSICLVDVKE
jgi:hypothetical protein